MSTMDDSGYLYSSLRDIRASEVDPRPVSWLLEQPMIPLHGISLIVGFRGAMKTTFAAWLSARVTDQGQNVFFASQEDDYAEFITPRLMGARADRGRVYYPHKEEPPFRFPRDVGRLAHYIQEREISLVALDPLGAFIPGFAQPATSRDALSPLSYISRELHCAIVLVHHFRKSGGRTVAEAIGGSGSLIDVARAVYAYGSLRQPEWLEEVRRIEGETDAEAEYRVLSCEKISAAPLASSLAFRVGSQELEQVEQVPRLILLGEVSVTPEMLLGSYMEEKTIKGGGRKSPAVDDATIFLQEILLDGPQPAKIIQQAAHDAGVSWRTCERAKLVLQIRAYRQDGKWWWALPSLPDTVPEEWT